MWKYDRKDNYMYMYVRGQEEVKVACKSRGRPVQEGGGGGELKVWKYDRKDNYMYVCTWPRRSQGTCSLCSCKSRGRYRKGRGRNERCGSMIGKITTCTL